MADPTLDILLSASGNTPVTAGSTLTFQYPDGRARGVYMDSGGPAILGVRSSQALYTQEVDFTLVFGDSSVVVTYRGVVPIAANTPVSLQLPLRDTSGYPNDAGGYAAPNALSNSGL